MAGQAIHVTNQSLIFATQPAAHSRLVSGYMLFYAVGSGLGAISSTSAYAAFGWNGVCVLGASEPGRPLVLEGDAPPRSALTGGRRHDCVQLPHVLARGALVADPCAAEIPAQKQT